jgi:hypothetical protein
MMTHCTQTAQQTERPWLSRLFGALVAATVVMATLQPTGLAAAAECFANEDTAAVQDTLHWEGISSPIQTLPTIILSHNCFCGLTPYLNSSRFVLGKADNPGNTIFTACLSLKSGKMGRSDQVSLSSIGTVTSQMQPLRTSALPYTGKRHVLKIRTTPPNLKPSAGYKPSALIGPVQEIQKTLLPDESRANPAIPNAPPLATAPALFEDYSLGPFHLFQSTQRLPKTESHSMNLTTTRALHGRDCVSECP